MALLEACDVSINGRYLEFYVLSSVESRSLGDIFLSAGAVMLLLIRLEYKTRVTCHSVNTQSLKFVRRPS